MNNIKHLIEGVINEYNNENDIINDNFFKWFGNSKVVDYNNNPLICYHGTNYNFTDFDIKHFNKNEPSGDYIGAGFYFTTSKEMALKYGVSNIIDCYLKIEKPLIINNYDEFIELMIRVFGYDDNNQRIPKYFILKKESPITIYNTIKKLGYDGLIDNIYNQYAVFEPTQIKSIENDGSWDVDDTNIYS